MAHRKLKSRIKKQGQVAWRNLDWLQNDDLKTLSTSDFEKLRTSFVNNDFLQPFFLWTDKNGKDWILDGKHRKLTMEDLETNGYTDTDGKHHDVKIPDKLPAVWIECANKKEAARAVLVFSSRYAKTTNQGVYEFINKFNLKLPDLKQTVDLPDVNWPKFEANFFNDLDGQRGGDEGSYATQFGLIIECEDAIEQEATYNKLIEQGYTVKVVNT